LKIVLIQRSYIYTAVYVGNIFYGSDIAFNNTKNIFISLVDGKNFINFVLHHKVTNVLKCININITSTFVFNSKVINILEVLLNYLLNLKTELFSLNLIVFKYIGHFMRYYVYFKVCKHTYINSVFKVLINAGIICCYIKLQYKSFKKVYFYIITTTI
jgi:hypothetical protein